MDVYETDPEADWQPYYLQEADWQNVYDSFRDNKYVVVRKGYEHPEIVMKIISVLFDYTRYGAQDADEVNAYFALNVDPTARPLVINIDYNEATFQITKDIQSVMSGMRKETDLSAIEKSYYDAAEKFIPGKIRDSRGLGGIRVQTCSSRAADRGKLPDDCEAVSG